MISRYSHEEMARVWSTEARWQALLDVEKAVAKSQAKLKIIPQKAWAEINKKACFQVKRIEKIEKKTHHDVIAFVTNVAENVGPYGRYIHYGLTSSDALDTATSVQLQRAYVVLQQAFKELDKAFLKLIKQHKKTLCAGRTHGIHAEPTTFGFKLAGFYQEFLRNKERMDTAIRSNFIAKLSGAVGTYSFQSEKIEQMVAKELKLKVEDFATQVIPRDRHASMVMAISLYAAGLDRLAIELRHLQRTEVSEVIEGFQKGQKGFLSHATQKNPISAENISGLCRVLKSYSQVAIENVSLWHERDISHSSTERIMLPDLFTLSHYVTKRMVKLLSGLYVDKDRMRKNMDISQGNLFSSHVLLALIEKGLSREKAYEQVQRVSHKMQSGDHLSDSLKKDKEVSKLLSAKEIDQIFSGKRHIDKIEKKLSQF